MDIFFLNFQKEWKQHVALSILYIYLSALHNCFFDVELTLSFDLNSVSFIEQKMDGIFDIILWNIGSWKIQRKSISFCPMGPWAWLQKPKSCHYWLWGQCCPDRTCNWYLNLTQKFKFQFWYFWRPFELNVNRLCKSHFPFFCSKYVLKS